MARRATVRAARRRTRGLRRSVAACRRRPGPDASRVAPTGRRPGDNARSAQLPWPWCDAGRWPRRPARRCRRATGGLASTAQATTNPAIPVPDHPTPAAVARARVSRTGLVCGGRPSAGRTASSPWASAATLAYRSDGCGGDSGSTSSSSAKTGDIRPSIGGRPTANVATDLRCCYGGRTTHGVSVSDP